MAAKQNITIDQGSETVITFTVYTSAGSPNEATVTDASLHVKKKWNDSANILALEVGNGLSITGGVITATIVPSDTTGLDIKGKQHQGVYNLEATITPNGVIRVFEGDFTIKREVVRT